MHLTIFFFRKGKFPLVIYAKNINQTNRQILQKITKIPRGSLSTKIKGKTSFEIVTEKCQNRFWRGRLPRFLNCPPRNDLWREHFNVVLVVCHLCHLRYGVWRQFRVSTNRNINTSYLTDSYIGFTLKMESVSKNTIFGLKIMVKSGLEKFILKSLHAGR